MVLSQSAQVNADPDEINFGIGQPGFDLLPVQVMETAAAHALAPHDPALLNYGFEPGDTRFRQQLADFLSVGYAAAVAADDLFITAGASQALDFICTLFCQRGDTIFVEEPSYFLALRIFRDHGLNIVGIPIDEAGLIPEALEAAVKKTRPRFLYTIPTFHNPSAVTLSQTRREQLVALSQAHNFLIVADEVYQLLNYTTTPPKPLAQFAATDRVLSIGSFSKILAPGLRLGWVQASHTHLQRLISSGLVDSGGGLNHFTSGVVRSVLELDLARPYLAQLKETYGGRAAALTTALSQELGDAVAFDPPAGGFFIWLRLADEWDVLALREAARPLKVGFQPGSQFSSMNGLHNYMRLSFAFYPTEKLLEGVGRLKKILLG